MRKLLVLVAVLGVFGRAALAGYPEKTCVDRGLGLARWGKRPYVPHLCQGLRGGRLSPAPLCGE